MVTSETLYDSVVLAKNTGDLPIHETNEKQRKTELTNN